MTRSLRRPSSSLPSLAADAIHNETVFDTAFVARTMDRLIAGRLQDLETLRQIALDMNAGSDGEALHRQLLVLARSAREAYDGLQQSREILVGLHKQASGGEVVAAVDRLTGLPNRAAFSARLGLQVASLTPARTLSLMLIELGSLQFLASEIGPGVANRVVKRFAAILRRTLKRTDYVARIGPQHFAVVFEDILPEKAVTIALRVHEAIDAKMTSERNPVADMLSVTMGIAAASGPDVTAKHLLAKAEEAVVQARKEGRTAIYVA